MTTDNVARRHEKMITRHPQGLWFLAGTELTERISFHGMQALLVLYMTEYALVRADVGEILGFPYYRSMLETALGPLSVTALAIQTFGLYVGLVYSAPLVGGWIGDRLVSRKLAVISGCLLIAAGQFALAFDRLLLIALALLIAGAGLLRGNLSTQVKALYADGDPREANAFQIYYVAINIGAVVAPILTGTLAAFYGWQLAFAVAGGWVLLGLGIYLAGFRHLALDPPRARLITASLNVGERHRLLALFLICLPLSATWVSQTQIWNAYNLWARDHLELSLLGLQVQIPWLQAFNGIVPIVAVAPLAMLWRFQAKRGSEPDPLGKLALGCILTVAGTVWLALAPLGLSGKAPFVWALVFHLLMGLGWLYTTPVTIALFAAKAPASYRGTMLGVANLTVFAGSIVGGRLGGLYEQIEPRDFWLLHACVAAAGAIFLMVFSTRLRRLLGA